MTLHVAGLDLAVSTTGVAIFREDSAPMMFACTEKPIREPTFTDELNRIRRMASKVYQRALFGLEPGDEAVFVFEGPAFAAKFGKPHERAGLLWILADALAKRGQIVTVTPGSVKSYWTHNGNADKHLMMSWTARRFPDLQMTDHNVNDAFAIAHMGARLGGLITEPQPPEVNASALAAVHWPELIRSTTP